LLQMQAAASVLSIVRCVSAENEVRLQVDQQQYFARVTAGLEQLVWQDIERRCDAQLIGFGHRRIDFAYAGTPVALLDLRGVDAIYVHAARLTGLDHTRASLARLTEKIAP